MRIAKQAVACAVVAIAAIALIPATHAQTISYSVGKQVTIDIGIHGKDADKATAVYVWIGLTTPVKPGQSGLKSVWNGQAQKIGDNFRATFTVQDDQAAGTYQVTTVRVVMDQVADFTYQKDEFASPTFQIDNPKTVDRPNITVTVH